MVRSRLRVAPMLAVGALVVSGCGQTPEQTEQARGVISGVPLVVAMTVAILVVAGGLVFAAVAFDRFVRSRRALDEAEREPEPVEEEPEDAEIAGIAQGSAGVPKWLYAAYVIIPLWAIAFIVTNVQVAGEVTPTEPAEETPTPDGDELEITALNIAFDKETLGPVPPETEITIVFHNEDAGIPHNVAIYETEAAQQEIFVGDIFNGVNTEEYTFTTPAAGEYYFLCDVHPGMNGTFLVEEGAAGEEAPAGEEEPTDEEGGAPTSTEITAENIAFDEETLRLAANTEVEIEFHNDDAGIPHNVAIYRTEAAQEDIFVGQIFNGPQSETYTFTAPEPGDYYFRCDVHPSMEGTITFA